MRPGPESVPVSRPWAGCNTVIPRLRKVSTLAWVAGLHHISVCIAGATTMGHVATRQELVNRSSARPWARRASRSAVAGAMTMRSASWPSRTCCTLSTSSKTSVLTGWCERASKVGAPTNLRAAGVGTTRTSTPASVK